MSDDPGSDAREPASGSRDHLQTATIVVATLLVGVAFVWAGLGVLDSSGGSSPTDAVDQLFIALDQEDAPGILAALAPAERAGLSEPLDELTDALHDMGVLTGDADEPLAGMEITADSISARLVETNGDSAVVDLIGGRLVVDGFDALDPRGRDAVELVLGLPIDRVLTRDFSQHPAQLATVAVDGGWYVSLLTPPESSNDDPRTVLASAGAGAASAESAVTEAFDALAAEDSETLNRLLVADLGGLLLVDSPLLGVNGHEGRPDIERTLEVTELTTANEPRGDVVLVSVTSFSAEFRSEIHQASLTYDGNCFTIAYRFDESDDPVATYETCNGTGTAIEIVTPVEHFVLDPTSSDAIERAARDTVRESRGGPIDSFGQPLESEAERALERPRARPVDNPFSVLAHFGGGADFPTFVVVESTNGGWKIDPLATALQSAVEVVEETTLGDVADWSQRAFHLQGNVRAQAALGFESRDPDNLLFGPPAASRLTAACFVEMVTVVGEGLAKHLYGDCISRLIDLGDVDPTQIPVAAILGECFGAPPTSPPALDNPYRLIYLADLATRACVDQAIADGSAPPELADNLPLTEELDCFGPYVALDRTDSEDAWLAADEMVAECALDKIFNR